jgi:DNA-binding MarR family transcriptional regulator
MTGRLPSSVPKADPVEELMVALQRMGRMLASRQVAARIITVAGVDVTQQGMTLLRVLLRDGKQSIATLASAAAMDLGAASRQVRLLEQGAAVRRSRSPDDARVALLELTARGRRIAERIREVSVRHLEDALQGWSDHDERTLASLMARLVDDLVATPVRPDGVTAGS